MDSGATNEDLPAMFHERLHSALELMVDFFHAEGQGLTTEQLHSATFSLIERQLQYHRTETEKLIEVFYGQRLQEQYSITSSPYGNLAVRAYFNHDSLCVEVGSVRLSATFTLSVAGAARSRHNPSGSQRV